MPVPCANPASISNIHNLSCRCEYDQVSIFRIGNLPLSPLPPQTAVAELWWRGIYYLHALRQRLALRLGSLDHTRHHPCALRRAALDIDQ